MATNAIKSDSIDNSSRIAQGIKLQARMSKETDYRDKAMMAHQLNCILSELGLGASLVVCNDSTLAEAGECLSIMQAAAKQEASKVMSSSRSHIYKAKKIRSVYSGKDGCACGCNGKHYYTSADRVAAGADRGYDVSDSEVSDRMVTRVIKTLLEHPSYIESGDNNFSLVLGGRLYIAYFN